jgi:hypothetical protein
MIIATPETEVPLPFHKAGTSPKDIRDLALRAFNTTAFLVENGLPIPDPTIQERKKARLLFLESPSEEHEVRSAGTAMALKMLMDEYDVEAVRNAAQLRNYIQMRLLLLSDSPKEQTQLKALELLGKMSDVNAFAENLNVSVTHRTKEELEITLADKLHQLIGDIEDAVIVPETAEEVMKKAPSVEVIDIDESLGFAGMESLDEESARIKKARLA